MTWIYHGLSFRLTWELGKQVPLKVVTNAKDPPVARCPIFIKLSL